jgi:hypothetical protein
MNAALGQVPGDAVLPVRLKPFHFECLELHREKCTSRSRAGSVELGYPADNSDQLRLSAVRKDPSDC